MSMTTAHAENLLKLYFQNVDHANIGDAGGLQNSVAAGQFHISLHTADPGETGNQTTNEATYTGYARVAVDRSSGEWAVSSGSDPATVDNVFAIDFDPCTAGSNTITHFGVGTAASGVGNLLWSAALDASLAVSAGITPSFAAGALNITAD